MRDQKGEIDRYLVSEPPFIASKLALTDIIRMGLTPLAGLPGATRSGDIDPS
jgi:hypothetical protein